MRSIGDILGLYRNPIARTVNAALERATDQVSPSLEVEAARAGLVDYLTYTNQSYAPNWHHYVQAEYLERLARGEITRLLILAPPQTGKSEMVSRAFPAFCFGQDPNEKIKAASYTVPLAIYNNRELQRYMISERHLQVFPRASLSTRRRVADDGDALRNATYFDVVNARGHYLCDGVGGAFTGFPATLWIIDDPYKNWEAGQSAKVRGSVQNWFESVVLTRGAGAFSRGGRDRIVVCLTPWHHDDLSGMIRRQVEAGTEDWHILHLPMVHEDQQELSLKHPRDPRVVGEPLWPAKYSVAEVAKRKAVTAPPIWQSLYKVRPTPLSGAVFQADWFKFYTEAERPDKFPVEAFSVDCAFKKSEGSSQVAIQRWGISEGRFYLLDQTVGRMSFTETLEALHREFSAHPNTTKLIEDKANGSAVIDVLKSRFGDIVPITPSDGKVERAIAATPMVQAGKVFLPEPSQSGRQWVESVFLREVLCFPSAKMNDQVDAMVQVLLHFGPSRAAIEALFRSVLIR